MTEHCTWEPIRDGPTRVAGEDRWRESPTRLDWGDAGTEDDNRVEGIEGVAGGSHWRDQIERGDAKTEEPKEKSNQDQSRIECEDEITYILKNSQINPSNPICLNMPTPPNG